ncbi:MAG: gamma-glutamyl-gamma-aminobutyrate hydrolase family protein [Pseudomonas oryzihabitans]
MSAYEIVLLGDHDPSIVAHQAIPQALALAAADLGIPLRTRWLPTAEARDAPVACDGLWCVPGSPYRDREGALALIRTVREQGIPFLGTCGGLQYALLEHARSVMGWADVAHAEDDPRAQRALLAPLSCARVEFHNRVRLAPGSRLVGADGAEEGRAAYHCRFGVNPDLLPALLAAGWRVLAWDEEGLPVAFELASQFCHFGTLYQPERDALDGRIPVAVRAWLVAVVAGRELTS